MASREHGDSGDHEGHCREVTGIGERGKRDLLSADHLDVRPDAFPIAQAAAPLPRSAQATRIRPLCRSAAAAQARAAIRAAAASPKSSTASVTWIPSIRRPIHTPKAAVNRTAAAQAIPKSRLAWRLTIMDLTRRCDDCVKPFLSPQR